MKDIILPLLVCTSFCLSCSSPKAYTVKVTGEGLGFYPDSSRVLVFDEEHSDIRFDEPLACGYLKDGCFSLSFRDSTGRICSMYIEEDIYDDGNFIAYEFFSDREPVHFTVSGERGYERWEITGSDDNVELDLFRREYRQAHRVSDSLWRELDRWVESRYGKDGWPQEGSEDEAFWNAEAGGIDSIWRSEQEVYDKWRYDRLRSHKSLAGLHEVTTGLRSGVSRLVSYGKPELDSALVEIYMEYRDAFPGHPKVKLTDTALSALDKVRPGMPYPDFEAPSTDGNRYALSELVAGRIAVLDCWASWCGSCRRHSMALIPLYEKYKDRGFTVIGVAREYGNLKAMEHAVKQDGYPWIQLYDLDGAEGIWDLYGIFKAGGGIFLIGKDGRIVEKVMDISSVRDYLEEHLGN